MNTQPIVKLLGRWFGGVTPDLRLTPPQVEEIRAYARPMRRRFYALVLPAALLLGALLAWLVISVRLRMDGPAVNAVLDERTRFVVMFLGAAALFGTLLGAAVLEFLLLRRLLRIDGDLWTRYYGTVHGWRPRRQMVFIFVIWAPGALAMIWGGWVSGARVDERGIAWGEASFRQQRQFSQVTSIEVYRSLKSSVGVVARPNLIVRFGPGQRWEYNPDPKAVSRPEEVADYVAKRSGVAVRRLGTRP